MEYLSQIKEKKGIWRVSRYLAEGTAHAIYPSIYVPSQIFDNLQSDSPSPENVRFVVHESVHIQRQQEKGWLLWLVFYAISKNFRLEEELEAIKAEMHFSKEQGIEFDLINRAGELSSIQCLYCISFDGAYFLLKHYWKQF